jgi:hypothetical protein
MLKRRRRRKRKRKRKGIVIAIHPHAALHRVRVVDPSEQRRLPVAPVLIQMQVQAPVPSAQ